MSSTEVILNKVRNTDFNPDKYVKELARMCVGVEELQNQRLKIQALSEDAANALKKNVYENHMQFIETSNEISQLEAEMYKLSHLLGEQRSVITALSSISVFGNDSAMPQALNPEKSDKEIESEKLEEQRKSKLNTIFEKVESCISLLDVPERMLLHEGDLLELDSEENTALQRMHAYLFNDCLMLTSWITNRRGPMRYRFQSVYPISSLAVVNVRDLGSVKQAFKLLAFPDTRVFQCNNINSKRDWLEKFDSAKKAYLEKEELKNAKKRESSQESIPSRPQSFDSPSNQDECIEDFPVLAEWLTDVAEELDVFIVERHFEEAYNLICAARKALDTEEYSKHPQKMEILNKVDFKQKNLIDVLMKELQVSPEWTPRGGLRSVRKPIRILNRLKMTSQASVLFLAICSQTLKVHVKSVQLEGTTVIYVKQVGEIFFCTVTDVISEFMSVFPDDKVSALVIWVSSELRILMNQITKQIFTPPYSLNSISECVDSLRGQAKLLCEFGLDVCFQLESSLRNPIVKALKDYKMKIVDGMKAKLLEDKWTPVNMNSKSGVNKFLQQMQEVGVVLAKYVINETWIDLSSSTIWFTQCIMILQCEGLRLITNDAMDVLDECIYAVFNGRLKLSIGNDSSYAQKNFKFLLDTVMPVMLKKYYETVGYDNEKLLSLAHKFGVSHSSPKKVAKYTSNEYL